MCLESIEQNGTMAQDELEKIQGIEVWIFFYMQWKPLKDFKQEVI